MREHFSAMSCAHLSMALARSHKEGVILALGIALRAPVKTCWKATQYLPLRPACLRPAELFHGLLATDD